MEKETILKQLVEELLQKIDINAEVVISLEEERYIVQLNTESDAPFLIGRFGETLLSLQRIIEAMMYKKINEETNILINVNDYRERQRERLEKIADNLAQRVIEQGRDAYLRSFSSYERKIIHEYIGTKYPDLVSHSEDEGEERKLVISKGPATE